MIQVPLVIWFIVSILQNLGATRAEFMAWLGEPLTAILMSLFVLSIFYHMSLGMAEVIEDYIHTKSTRKALLRLNSIVALILGTISFFSIISITLIV